jgi:hypothetical protein
MRSFRDRLLMACQPGRTLVSAYYRCSPAAAGFISRNPGLKPYVRTALYPVAGMASLALGMAVHPGVGLGFLLAGGGLAALVRRRRAARDQERRGLGGRRRANQD